jgi:hypothetical protein
MVRKINELRATPDDVLIAEHDAAAVNTIVGTDYYMEELDRRSRDRFTQQSHQLAQRTYWLAVASAVLSVVAVIASVLALVA